ncbi:BON domain-containing protein [Psychrobacter sp. CAL346-MNA-CIBAN-0220]|uniref:BON domain-containing protein n=1 Tax=Psychrobacter sp. CAL346-MNA-CIBAN-0220 TaxID=3140457 RepID=UPI003321ECEA
MTMMHSLIATSSLPRRAVIGAIVITAIASTGCATNYLTNSTDGTYGVPVTERTIPQRLLDRSIEHTVKINVYGLQENLQQNSRMSIDSFNSEVLLAGEVPTEALKAQIEQVVSSMPDIRRVYNELNVSVAKGYSSTVHDTYINSKLMAKVAANDNVKASQIRAVTNDGVVYVMGRMTPTQQSHLIDVANSTVGITELVLLTTLFDDTGAPISDEDIMFESNLADTTRQPTAIISQPSVRNSVATGAEGNTASVELSEDTDSVEQAPSSPYIDRYQTP